MDLVSFLKLVPLKKGAKVKELGSLPQTVVFFVPISLHPDGVKL